MRLTWRDVEVVPGRPPIFTSVTAAERAELEHLAQGRVVLEIGSAYGYSAIVMSLAGAEDVWSIDPHLTHDSLEAFCSNIERFGLEGRVKVCVGTSRQIAEVTERDGSQAVPYGHFGLVFIDGDHTLEGCRFDIQWPAGWCSPAA